MREIRQSGSEGGGAKPIASPYPYRGRCLQDPTSPCKKCKECPDDNL